MRVVSFCSNTDFDGGASFSVVFDTKEEEIEFRNKMGEVFSGKRPDVIDVAFSKIVIEPHKNKEHDVIDVEFSKIVTEQKDD